MTSIDPARIETARQAIVDFVEREFEDNWTELAYSTTIHHDVPGVGTLRLVEQVGGEGEGDHYHLVFEVILDQVDFKSNVPVFFKIDGFYSSYDGVDFDEAELYRAEPRNKVVVEYDKVS